MATEKKPVKKAPVKKAAPVKKTVRKQQKAGEVTTTTTIVSAANPETIQGIVKEFTEQATGIAKQATDYQQEWGETVAKENIIFKKRNRLLIAGMVVLICLSAFSQYRSIFVSGPLLNRLDKNQAGIDKLVDFVESIDASACNGTDCPPSQTEVLLNGFIQVLCSSNDKGQQQACIRLGYIPNK